MRSSKRLWLTAVSIAVAVAAAPVARAECPEESWRSQDPAWVTAVAGDDGIGGSGLAGDEDGIGGSGVLGTITGFGSICINGHRIAYDADVPVTVMGEVRGSEALAVGQVVAVEMESGTTSASARAITVRYAVVGPAEAMGETLSVLGQKVELVPEATALANLLGKRVAVSGLRRSDGTIVASRVDIAGPELADAVRGVLAVDSDGSVHVAGVPVADATTAGLEGASNALAIGSWDPVSRTLMEAQVTVDSPFAADVLRVDIEGYVGAAPDGQLSLGGSILSSPGLLAPSAGGPFEFDARVRVRAVRNTRGDLEVRRVFIVREHELMDSVAREAVAPMPALRLKHQQAGAADAAGPDGRQPSRPRMPEFLRDRRVPGPGPPGDWGPRKRRPHRRPPMDTPEQDFRSATRPDQLERPGDLRDPRPERSNRAELPVPERPLPERPERPRPGGPIAP